MALYQPKTDVTRGKLVGQIVELPAGTAKSIVRHGQTVEVIHGGLWVSFDGVDVFAQVGERLVLPAGIDAAVMSSSTGDRVVVCIC
ncbi:MAG: hypothetical protein SF123_20330 [Chloroflexota bacterium]|nr:hypothetical protein [Chloroflexota bacterium]